MPLHFRPEVLKRARLEQGLSRDRLARRAGIGRVSVFNAESGRTAEPQARIVKALADALGLSIADLYEESEPVDGDAA